MAASLIIAIRLIVPLAILRWPFWGMLAAIAADASDVIIRDALGVGEGVFHWTTYHAADKAFDTYALGIGAYAASRWNDVLARRTIMALFLWRLAGVAAFEISGSRQIFLFAPNIFENFYLLVAGLVTFRPGFRISTPRVLIVLFLIAAIPKIAQEYIMHFIEFPTWLFFKETIFRWH